MVFYDVEEINENLVTSKCNNFLSMKSDLYMGSTKLISKNFVFLFRHSHFTRSKKLRKRLKFSNALNAKYQ